MNVRLVFLIVIAALEIFCNQPFRKSEDLDEEIIFIGHWRHYYDGIDRCGMPLRGPRSDLILNKNSTYLISTENIDYSDDGSFIINNDTLYLISSHYFDWNREFIFAFDFKYQNMKLFPLNENQRSALIHLFGEWNKINRFGQQINLDGAY